MKLRCDRVRIDSIFMVRVSIQWVSCSLKAGRGGAASANHGLGSAQSICTVGVRRFCAEGARSRHTVRCGIGNAAYPGIVVTPQLCSQPAHAQKRRTPRCRVVYRFDFNHLVVHVVKVKPIHYPRQGQGRAIAFANPACPWSRTWRTVPRSKRRRKAPARPGAGSAPPGRPPGSANAPHDPLANLGRNRAFPHSTGPERNARPLDSRRAWANACAPRLEKARVRNMPYATKPPPRWRRAPAAGGAAVSTAAHVATSTPP